MQKSSKINVVHVVAGLNPRSGGPSRTVVQLADSLARLGYADVTLLTQARMGDPTVPSLEDVDRRDLRSTLRPYLACGLPMRGELERIARLQRISIIHNHGMWLTVNYWAGRIARNYGIPLIIHPRGMLEPWALKHKAWKKRIALTVFQRRHLETAKVLIATSEEEFNNIRNLGLIQPVAIIPNGVELVKPKFARVGSIVPTRVRTALFLSRVHQKKGVLNLVRAWSELRPDNWRLTIAGPDEGAHLEEVMKEAGRLGVADCIDYLGEVDGDEKAAVYRGADLFVLPTFSENFGVVVAEALAYGLPVITTRGAPWGDLVSHRCGWWIEIGVEPLKAALREAMNLSDHERWAMGERGRKYVQRYNWTDIAAQTSAVYRWVLGQEERPDFLHLN